MTRQSLFAFMLVGSLSALGACTQDDRSMNPDADKPGATASEAAGKAGDRVAAAAETVDVKAALALDSTVDASDINVDTDHSTKVVTLKGHVPTAEQRARAEVIAKREATDYRIDNQLIVADSR